MKRWAMVVGCLLFTCSMVWAQGVTFNYEGRIKIDGNPYTGDGYFKFAIVDVSGDISHWSNDGTSTVGNEPSAAIVSSVTDGVFNVIIGDASIANMSVLIPSMFNAREKVFLRVWFSDTGSAFEQLVPDREITNPALLGIQTSDELIVYVDAAMGDDRFTGYEEDRPKKTIQSAWDSIPSMVRSNVTVRLAQGIYRESVLLAGKTLIGDATISLVGDRSAPGNVILTGADSGNETLPVRTHGLTIRSQKGVYVKGIQLQYFSFSGIYFLSGSHAYVWDCKCLNNRIGIYVTRLSILEAKNVEAGNGLGGSQGI
ncbi:MAG TPA: hypothetical protein PKH07_08965, partial [bacterium]|nr:hypothetical protein [bacterium]